MKTARVHHAARRRGGGVAARGARAAAGESCRPSGYLGPATPAVAEPTGRRLSCSDCANSAGSRAATVAIEYRWAEGRSRALPARSRPSSSGLRSMSSSRLQPRRSSPQSRRHRSSRSCSRRRATRSAPAWSRAWRGRAATSPACRCSRPNLPASGSNSCARSSPVCAGLAIMGNADNPATVLEMDEVAGSGPQAWPRGHSRPKSGVRRTSRLRSTRSRAARRRCTSVTTRS